MGNKNRVKKFVSATTGGIVSEGSGSERANRMLTGALSGGTSLLDDSKTTKNMEKTVGDMYFVTNQKSAIGEPVKEYLNPTPPKVEPDLALAKMQEEEEARRRARRFGRSLLISDSTASGVSLGV
jgi:hypothetical protein